MDLHTLSAKYKHIKNLDGGHMHWSIIESFPFTHALNMQISQFFN